MRNTCLFLLACFLIVNHVYAQANPYAVDNHAIYAELGGQGMELSLNYDTRLSRKKDGWGLRVGVGDNLSNSPGLITIPVGVNYLIGHGGNYFEMGAGETFASIGKVPPNTEISIGNQEYHSSRKLLFENVVLGYRRQPTSGGLSFRTGLSPCFGGGRLGMLLFLSLGCNF